MQLELKHIQQRLHVTVIYVTHDQEEALTMSDRVAVMQGGRIEQVGRPAELYDRPASRFVADFLGESNFLDAVVVAAEPDGRRRQHVQGPGRGSDLRGRRHALPRRARHGRRSRRQDTESDGGAASVHGRRARPRVVAGGHPALSPPLPMTALEERRDRLRHLLALAPALIVLAALFAYPLLGIVMRSVYKSGYTLDLYRQIFRVPVYLQVLGATFKVAAIVTLVCLLLGYPLAYVLATRRPRTAQLLMIIIVLPFFTSI